MTGFDYATAFQRNLGFLSPEEQQRLRGARIAIAGLGGTGGAQAHVLARQGIGAFTLADPDTFELANFNRQMGATMATLGRGKAEVAAEAVHAINPEAEVRTLDSGLGPDTIDAFLEGADLVVDSLDFYCFAERFLLYRRARERNLWVITSPPLGFGFTLLIFDPAGMSFEEYFGFDADSPAEELTVSLVAGIAPRPYLMRYLETSATDLAGGRLPSVAAAPFLIAGVVATETVNLLTGKRHPVAVPTVFQFDALLHRFLRKRFPRGMRGPLQRLKKALLRRKFGL
ncbi:MAG TPA: ThiF family adenylyltransferase [Gammaproteobacteria bacterium]|nr:ThiF family adenylyltransferase [Gammaproteobacteria bacterium]